MRASSLLAPSLGCAAVADGAQSAGFLDVRDPCLVLSVGTMFLLSPLDHPLGLPAIARSLGDVRADWRAMLRDAQASFPSYFFWELVVGAAVLAAGVSP